MGSTFEHRGPGSTDLAESRAPGWLREIAQEQEVHDVTRAVVDARRRIVKIRHGMELLRDLEPHGDTNENVRVRQAEAS